MHVEDMTNGVDRPQQAHELGIPAHGQPFGDLLTELVATRESTKQILAKYYVVSRSATALGRWRVLYKIARSKLYTAIPTYAKGMI